jgi:hypothetical protein
MAMRAYRAREENVDGQVVKDVYLRTTDRSVPSFGRDVPSIGSPSPIDYDGEHALAARQPLVLRGRQGQALGPAPETGRR